MAADPRLELLESGEPAALKAADLRGVAAPGAALHERDLSGLDLSDADLSGADLSAANLSGARLVGTNLRGANLTGCELMACELAAADLRQVQAARAGFGGAQLHEARLSEAQLEGATFSHAQLAGADLGCTDLRGARIHEANLRGASFARADARQAELVDCPVDAASFERCDLRGARLASLTGYTSASWVLADVRDADFRGGFLLRRVILDENFLHEFRSRGRSAEWVYRVWKLTSDCGRSMTRWALSTLLIVLLFAGLFSWVQVDFGDYPTWLSPFYFSVVTLTTLGYGDVLPMSVGAQVVAMLEVTFGYLALSGLISIFANKMARRAE